MISTQKSETIYSPPSANLDLQGGTELLLCKESSELPPVLHKFFLLAECAHYTQIHEISRYTDDKMNHNNLNWIDILR